MPYLVITTRPDFADPDDLYREAPADPIVVSLRAVATLEEARRAIAETSAMPEATATWVFGESGGTVGPLPDGSLIEVDAVDWHKLARESGSEVLLNAALNLGERIEYWPGIQESILAAFNAKQAGQ
jgi:hypothetical protein